MNILIVSQYFYPENFRINDLCYGLKDLGHNVTVLTGKPNYPHGSFYKGYSWYTKQVETIKRIRVYRSNGDIVDMDVTATEGELEFKGIGHARVILNGTIKE